MILVRNLLQPSNGNKILFLILIVLLGSSCGILNDKRSHRKPTKRPRPVQVPERNNDNKPQEDDIIEIPILEDEDLYEKYGSEFKQSYRVGLILPLSGKNYLEDLAEMENDVSYRFINYYAGSLMSLEDLENEKISFEVEVINSSMKSNDTERLIRKLNLLDLDIIVGPYERNLLKEVALYGRRKGIPVISPWQSSSKITSHNPNYIQLKPDIKEFYHSIVEHIDASYLPQQVYLLGRSDKSQEKSRLKYLQEFHLDSSVKDAKPYNVFYLEEDSLHLGETAFDSIFLENKHGDMVFVLPNWSYRDEQFIYSCARKLNAEKLDAKVVLYGMPIMMQTEKIGYNLYKSLNLHIAIDTYMNPYQYSVINFKKRFFNQFHALPTEDALEGYDVMQFVGQNLLKHGTKFQYFIQDDVQQQLHTAYDVIPKRSEEGIEKEDFEDVQYFQNRHVEIRRFNRNHFEKAD